MAVHVFILFLMSLFLREVSGIDDNAVIDIQPMNPIVREGDGVILNCYSGIKGVSVRWNRVTESYSMFQIIERHSFPDGSSLHLFNASRLRGEVTSETSFMCAASNSHRRITNVTIVPRSNPLPLQSSLVVTPAYPVAQNGSNISLTCINPSENGTDIGWYVSGEEQKKFSNHEVEKFENGAHLRIVDINVDSLEEEILVLCLQQGSTPVLTEGVAIRVTEMIPTTEAPYDTQGPAILSTVTVFPLGTTPPDRDASRTAGVPASLVLIAIAIGAGLAVFCICMIFLSVYTLFYFRSQSFDFLAKGSEDDVFKTTPRSIDNVHPYQSVTEREGGDAASDGPGKSGYTELNQYDVAGGATGNKAPYADLTPYEEPRVYMRLESESASKPKPAKREVAAPDGVYDAEIGTQISSFKQETTSQV